jgi:hypothetical protein
MTENDLTDNAGDAGLHERTRVTSDELSHEVADFIGGACARVLGPGQAQYEKDGSQKFEELTLEELVDWAVEELQDVAVYSTMLAIRIKEVQRLVENRVTTVAANLHLADIELADLRSAIPRI